MLHLTAVAPKGKEDGCNIIPETGIFVTHSPTKTYTTSFLIMLLVFLLCFKQQCLASFEERAAVTETNAVAETTAVATESDDDNFKVSAPAPYECQSMVLRHNCKDFHRLFNCTVVTGFLSLGHFFGPPEECFETYKFVKLREITDFLIFSNLREFPSIKEMFPSLTVIRGRRLFRNYALIFSDYKALEKVEFKSLIAIQRGHVLIEGSKRLCFIEKINWNRLTLGKGNNNIFPHRESNCTEKARCSGCKRDACWSNEVCQKFEDDSVLSLTQEPKRDCHEECLGGCYNRTAQGCVVCKSYTDHNTCVKECPKNKYASSLYLRCYTRDECVKEKELLILNKTCVHACPPGYKINNDTQECEPCDKNSKDCLRICTDKTFYISDISHAEVIEFCQIINGSLVIDMYEYFDPEELKVHLKNIIEITGFLKINKSPHLTSLDFLENLQKIHGKILENNQFAVIIYNNIRLSELWNLKPGFEIVKGGMYIHANDKLCNRLIREFRRGAKHDKSLDSIQPSDQEVLCSPATLNLYGKVLNHRSIKLYWPKNETSVEVEIAYKPVAEYERITEKSELDPDVCNRIKWHRELKFSDELQANSEHYIFIIQDLKPRTRYAILVKTFNGDDDTQEARSEIKYIITNFDIPKPPRIAVKSKTFNTLQIEFFPDNTISSYFSPQVVDFYNLKVYHLPEDKNALDQRNYCDDPAREFREFPNESYADCCSRLEKEREDKIFLSQLREEFSCSLDHKEFCTQNNQAINEKTMRKAIFKKRFEARETNFTIQRLKSYQLYVLQMEACNHAGCGSYSIISARTNYSLLDNEVIDLSICRDDETNEYSLKFSEPKQQNGYIGSYYLYMRENDFKKKQPPTPSYFQCIRRSELEKNNYIHKTKVNLTLNQATLKVISLGHHTLSAWFNITSCDSPRLAGNFWNYFIGFFVTSLICIITWLCYKRRFWQKLPGVMRRYVPVHTGWRYLRPSSYIQEDRQILVDGFEILSFRNISEDDTRYIELQEISSPE